MRAFPIVALFVAAGACVPQGVPPAAPPVAVAPSSRPIPAPVVATDGDWRDRPLTPGAWTWRRDARGSIALFGAVGRDAWLTLRCDLGRRLVFLSIAGSGTAPPTIRTSSMTRTLAMQPTGGTPPYMAVALAPNDGLLDAMGFSRGRFVVEQAGGSTLVVPAWAEIERVTEDCRG